MKQLLVVSHDTYASGLTPNTSDLDNLSSLAVGAYAMIDKDPESAQYDKVANIAAASESETPTKFQFAVMTANGLKMTPIITKANCTVKNLAYTAPVAKTMNIALVVASPQVGVTYGFMVTDLSKPTHVLTRNRTYTIVADSATTGASINTALIALVNADASRCVNASAGVDIVLTAKTAGNGFQISMMGGYRSAVVTSAQAQVLGTGTYAQMLALEKEADIEMGKTNYPQYRDVVFTKVSELTSTDNYIQYVLRHKVDGQRPILPNTPVEQEVTIAVKSTLTAAGTADKSLEGLSNFEIDFNV